MIAELLRNNDVHQFHQLKPCGVRGIDEEEA